MSSQSCQPRRGQTEPCWGRNVLKDSRPEEEEDSSEPTQEPVIIGRLGVVFDDKNNCEKSSAQVISEPPFPSSISSLTLSQSQEQDR